MAINIDGKDIRVLTNLCWSQLATISIDGEPSDWTKIKRGVRQDCVLSPDLFSLYTEIIMRRATTETSFIVNGKSITNMRYAEDIVLFSDNEQQAQNLLENLNRESEKKGLTINKKKIKIMVFSKRKETPTSSVKLNNVTIEKVESFNYLDSLLTSDCKCDREIKRRITLAKKSFMNKKSIITNNVMSIESKKSLLYVLCGLLYYMAAKPGPKAKSSSKY